MSNEQIIESLKTSVEMWVWDEDIADKETQMIVYINEENQPVDEHGSIWDNYELIKEPTYRPYNENDDLSELLGLKIRQISGGSFFILIGAVNISGKVEFLVNKEWYDNKAFFEQFTHINGTPFGVKE